MRVLSVAVIILWNLCLANVDYGQRTEDSFVGNWVSSPKDESVVLFITRAASRYKVSVSFAATPPDQHGIHMVTLRNSKLVGGNGLLITRSSKNKIHVSGADLIPGDYEGLNDGVPLERVVNLSEFYGIWKVNPQDKKFLLIYRNVHCVVNYECKKMLTDPDYNCYEVQLTENWSADAPMSMPKRQIEYPCRTGNLLRATPRNSPTKSIDEVQIELVSDGVIRVNWKGQNISNTIYKRIGLLSVQEEKK